MGPDVSLQADPGVARPATSWLSRDAAWSDRRPAILLMGDSLDRGGAEGQFVEVATRLDRSRWDVHVSCLRAEGPLRTRLETAGVRPWGCGRGSLKSPPSLGAV